MHDERASASAVNQPHQTDADLVEYLVLTVPNLQSLERVAASLHELSESATVRLLDVVVLERDDTGSVKLREIDELEEMRTLGALERPTKRLLSTHDLELVSPAVPYDSVGVIVVTEDRWAAPLSNAVTLAGGHIVGGERIPSSRLDADEA